MEEEEEEEVEEKEDEEAGRRREKIMKENLNECFSGSFAKAWRKWRFANRIRDNLELSLSLPHSIFFCLTVYFCPLLFLSFFVCLSVSVCLSF